MQGSPNSKSKEIIEINYIACTQAKNMQEFSFDLKLLNANINEQELLSIIFPAIQNLIIFLKPCLQEGKFFTHNQDFVDKVGGFFSGALYKAQGKKEKKEKEQINTLTWGILRENFGSEIKAQNFSAIAIKQEILKVLQQGITIKLRANIKDIKLDNFKQIKAHLEEKLKQAKNKEQNQIALQVAEAQQETTQNKQVVPFTGSFSFRVAREINCKAPVVTAAIENNIPKYKIFFPLSNFLNDVIRLFFSRIPKLSTQKLLAITYHSEPKNQEHGETEVDGRKRDRIVSVVSRFPGVGPAIGCVASYVIKKIDQSKKKKAEQLCQLDKSGKDQDIGQTTSRIDRFKAKRKKSKVKVEQTQEQLEEKQLTIKQAQNDARIALLNNKEGKKLDEIFIEIVSEYKNQDPETFRNIFNSVFNIVYFEDKRLHKILETDEVSEVLETLPIRKPMNNSLLDKEYLQEQAYREKEQLFKLVTGIDKQQPPAQPKNPSNESTNPPPSNVEKNKTPRPLPAAKSKRAKNPLAINTAFKSSLETVFSSKEAYFCLFVIGVSISIFCLWHLPLGEVPILQSLVQEGKREYIGLTLNIGLPILIALCVLNVADFVRYQYSIESIGQVNLNKHPSRT